MNNCQTCGVETPNVKFCSRSCSGKSGPRTIAKFVEKLCVECGSAFMSGSQTKEQKFCNRSCSASYNNRIYKKKSKSKEKPNGKRCAFCQKELTASLKRKYCSRKCMGLALQQDSVNRFLSGSMNDSEVRNKSVKRFLLSQQYGTCALCPTTTDWMGKPLVLITDHIDGDSGNNHPDNIRLVCPNCDSQLDTYKARNMGNGRHHRRERFANGQSY